MRTRLIRLLSHVLLVTLAACTAAPPTEPPLPTRASVSSQQTDNEPPKPTAIIELLTRESELDATLSGIRVTQTTLALTPSLHPTDCGALAWWNYAGGSAIDFMHTLSEADAVLSDPPRQSGVYDEQFTIGSSYADSLAALINDIAKRDYSLCVKSSRDALIDAMQDYHNYLLTRALSLSTSGAADKYTPDKIAAELSSAREAMKSAANSISLITGADTSVLLNDGIHG